MCLYRSCGISLNRSIKTVACEEVVKRFEVVNCYEKIEMGSSIGIDLDLFRK